MDYYFYVAENFKEIVKMKENQNRSIMHLVHELMVSEYSAIDEKCKTYHLIANQKKRKEISNDIKSFIERFSSKENIEKLEKRVDRYQDGLMADFRRDLPNLKSADYKLFLFSVLGFSVTAISLFLDEEKPEAIYSRKARLKSKIKLLDERYQQRYLAYL